MSTLETFDVRLAHGITLACRAAGAADAPRLVFLHGFPEAAFAWDAMLEAFAPTHRAIAPNLRGYPGSSAPVEVEAYRAKHLVADVAALIESQGGPVDALVAHDWGGAVAWTLAAQRPELLKRLVIVNSPHPATFLRALRTDPAQQQASAYMNYFCRPDAAAKLAADGFARLWQAFDGFGGGAPAAWLDETLRARYREAWSAGLDGPLNWYRASPLRPPTSPDDAIHRIELPDAAVTVRVPTLAIWGEADRALLPSLLDGLEAWVPRLRVVRVPGASHWIVHERPELVAAEIRRALAE